MEKATLDFRCGECHLSTSKHQPLKLGENTVDLTCSHCGEQWHITYTVLSIDPLSIASGSEIKRLVGILRDGVFTAKGQMQ